jgi:C-terminal processing protease CtpA/Prc
MRRPLRVLAALTSLLLAGCGPSPTERRALATIASPNDTLAPGVATHLNQILDLMQNNSINRGRIDWPVFRAQVIAEAGIAADIPQAYTAIKKALMGVGDGHSFYTSTLKVSVYSATRDCRTTAAIPITTAPPTIGVIRITSFSGSGVALTRFATDIQSAIAAADRDDLQGWIVDLRGNGGGNMWPMLAGIGPILGSGPVGFFIYPNGTEVAWDYRQGASYNGTNVQARVAAPYQVRKAQPRVAVLTDLATASSAEAIAVAFRERPNTRSFGAPTCGLSTSNTSYTLNDGATLNLVTSLMADRTKRTYGDTIYPDESIFDQQQTIDRAIAWLQTGR